MSWGARRRALFLFILFLLVGIPTAIVAVTVIYKPATCFDGAMNQDELGVDCGGSCSLLCTDESLEPIVRWQRFFPVSTGLYTVAAVVENPNGGAKAERIPYVFRAYDELGIPIYERRGTISLAAKEIVPIIEPGIVTNDRTLTNVTFELTQEPEWIRSEPEVIPILIRDIKATGTTTRPSITARLLNEDIVAINSFEVDVVVYGASGNAIAASQTLIDSIPPAGESLAIFTWPRPFEEEIQRIEVFPKL